MLQWKVLDIAEKLVFSLNFSTAFEGCLMLKVQVDQKSNLKREN